MTATINLPSGLQLAGGQNTITLGSINANSNRSVSWNVAAGTALTTVSKTITVSAQGTNADTVQQSKTITVQKAAISGEDALEEIGKMSIDELLGLFDESCVGEPVDTSTGAFVMARKLLVLYGARDFDFIVHYNALLLQEGPMGRGWGHNFETSAEILPSGDVVIHWDTNRKNTFVKNASDQFVSQDLAIRFDTLVKNADGSYTLTRKDQSVYLFNPAGKLVELKNGHGQSLTMTYDGSGRLATITELVSGQSFTLSYNAAGFVESVTGSSNRRVSFAYDNSHNLTGITDQAGNTTTYTYNADGRLLTIADAQGVLITNTYDDQGRVAVQDDAVAGNQPAKFNYDETTATGKVITTYTDRSGNDQVFTHDSKYQLLSIKDELGKTKSYTYDADGNRTSETDAASHANAYIYDSRGNLLTATDPAGHVSRMTYDERNNLLLLENSGGKRITFTNDANNNPLSITDPLGNTTSFSYDGNGLMTSQTNPGSGTTTYSYQNGLLHSVTSPEGSTTTLSYDAAGQMTGVTDGADNTTRITYDNMDNLLTVADPLGNTYLFTYDSRGNRLTETDPRGEVTRFEYNGNGKLISTVDALNNRTGYEYDGEDRLVRTVNTRGYATTLVRDDKGRIIGITDPLGKTTTFEYNALDYLVGQKDSLGNRILTVSYDALNNPVTVTVAQGNTTTNQYDVLNRLTAVTDPLGRVTQFGYDGLNRLTSTTDDLGGQSSQSFDPDGNLTALADPNGNRTGFSLDRDGRLIAETTAWGSTISYGYNAQDLFSRVTNGRGQTTSLRYDVAGRLLSFSDPEGTVSYTYDANGNVLIVSDSAGTITRQYDALNRVTEYSDARGNTIRYDYDAVGNLITLTYPGGKEVQYDYDAADRLTQVTDWAGQVTTYEYDANGRLVRTVRSNGTEESRSYDAAGQLTRQHDIDGQGKVIVQYDYTYDAAGNITVEQAATTALPFSLDSAAMTYDAGNRLATFKGQPVSYDADGNMITGPLAGKMATYVYDARNRLLSAGNLSYQYDAENNRISVTDSVYNTEMSYVINTNTPLSQVLIKTDYQGNQTFYVYGLGLIGQEENGVYTSYHFDLRGSTVALADSSGNVTDRFQYGPYGEIVNHTGNTTTQFLYNGRDGVLTDANGLYYMRARYYNPESRRFVNQDILQGQITDSQSQNRHIYCQGNPVMYIDPTGQTKNPFDYNNETTFWDDYFTDYFAEIADYTKISSLRTPDYYTFEIGLDIPSMQGVSVPAGIYTIDRYFNFYKNTSGVSAGIGKKAIAVSGTGGWILDWDKPDEYDLKKFLDGSFTSESIGFVVGLQFVHAVGMTAFEMGGMTPQVGTCEGKTEYKMKLTLENVKKLVEQWFK